MKKQLLLISAMAFFGFSVNAQKHWKYGFGTQVGNLSPVSAAGIASSSDGVNTHVHEILAAPENQQIARVWTGNNNVSGYTLVNGGGIGSGSRLLLKTPASSSTSKFSILNIDGTSVMSIAFKIKFQAGTKADYRFVVGRDATAFNWGTASGGTQFSNNINFNENNAQPAILMMHWNLLAGVYKLSVREKPSVATPAPAVSGFKTLNATLNPNVSFENGGEYDVQIYANNTAGPAGYAKTNTTSGVTANYSIAAQSSHIWINGVRLVYDTNNYDFYDAGNSLVAGAALNAFVFMGYNATENDAQVYMDDFTYANYLTDLVTLPIQLTGFNAVSYGNSVKVNWSTATETNNAHFELLRSTNGKDFVSITTVKGGGDTQTEQLYTYTDQSPLAGTSYYQLKQVDFNGASSLSKVVVVKSLATKNQLSITTKPEQQTIELNFYAEEAGIAILKVMDISGKKLLERRINLSKGNQAVTLPFNLPKGLYVGSLKKASTLSNQKFIF